MEQEKVRSTFILGYFFCNGKITVGFSTLKLWIEVSHLLGNWWPPVGQVAKHCNYHLQDENSCRLFFFF